MLYTGSGDLDQRAYLRLQRGYSLLFAYPTGGGDGGTGEARAGEAVRSLSMNNFSLLPSPPRPLV